MKKNILLVITLLLELLFILMFTIPSLRDISLKLFPFSLNIWESFKHLLKSFADLIKISSRLSGFPLRLTLTISLIIINVIYIVIYEIFAFIIGLLIKRAHKKNLIANKLDNYELTEEEKAKFSWKLYQKHFSWLGLFSFIIPTLIVIFLITLRFDRNICALYDKYNVGFDSFYSNSIYPFINSFMPIINKYFLNFIKNYIYLINGIVDIIKVKWIEYIVLVIVFAILYFLWFFIVWVLKKVFSKPNAKRRSNRAKKKYIAKMEKLELKARKDADERISSNAQGMGIDPIKNNSLYEDVSIISLRDKIEPSSFSNVRNADYIDDISTGVIDLGVASSGEEDKEPIEKKIPVFIGEEDVDIILENEPVIETIEEDTSSEFVEDDEPFFEKYIPDSIDFSYLDESLLFSQVDVIEENSENVVKDEIVSIKKYIDKKEETPTENVEIISSKLEDNSIIDEIAIEEDNKPLKKVIKKPLKPIEINAKFDSHERFKNPRKKYLDYKNNKIDSDFLEKKKRNLIRRKKHK